MSAEEAFNYIPTVIQTILVLHHDFLIWNALYFLMSLYSIANTTEIHSELKRNWRELSNHFSNYSDSYKIPFQELKIYLRISEE